MTSQARGIKHEGLNDTSVAEYLQTYPDFFERNSPLLTKLRLPHLRDMGATVSLLVAGKRPDLVASLALIEPVILPAAAYAFSELPFSPFQSPPRQAPPRKALSRSGWSYR